MTLPRLHPLQRAIVDSPAKRKVVCAGRRSGKTTLAAYMAVTWLLNGKRVLLSSTSQDQADVFWEYVTDWLAPLLGTPYLYKHEVKRLLRLGAGQIWVKTGRNPDALRGGMADLLVLDECAYLDANAWRKVGAPMLADTDGTAVFISTPARRNWFFELYQQAQQSSDGRWQAWHFTTLANPYLAPDALAALTADMTQDDYAQEIEAQFLEGAGSVFRYVNERCTAQRAEPYFGNFVFGLDWAQARDYTVIAALDADARVMVDMERFNGVDWALQRGRVAAMCEKWRPRAIVAESNSVGGPNIEALQREGLPVVAFETTAVTKPPLIESLVLAFDRGEITALDDAVLKGELMAYERRVTPTGRSQYSAPEGLHDDCVMALALAWHGVVNQRALAAEAAPDFVRDYRG